MKYVNPIFLIFIFQIFLFKSLYSQSNWSKRQKQVLKAIEELSASTAPNGKGAEAYGKLLEDDFSRWTIGSEKTSNKKSWINGIKEWFDEGWRVSDRKVQNIEIAIKGNLAFTRRLVMETYLSPKNETSSSKAALAEVWVNNNKEWKLLRVDVHSMNE